jgi:hypothetical protein
MSLLADSDRFRLLHGPYGTPKCKVGDFVSCAVRGLSEIGKFSDHPIPWPVSAGKSGALIIFGDLEKAIRCESEIAVMGHFGLGRSTVVKYRRLLETPRFNEGTTALAADYAPLNLPSNAGYEAAKEKLLVKNRAPKSDAWKASQSLAKAGRLSDAPRCACGRYTQHTAGLRRHKCPAARAAKLDPSICSRCGNPGNQWICNACKSRLTVIARRKAERIDPVRVKRRREANNAYNARIRAERNAAGNCIDCGLKDQARGQRCENCAEQRNRLARERRAK